MKTRLPAYALAAMILAGSLTLATTPLHAQAGRALTSTPPPASQAPLLLDKMVRDPQGNALGRVTRFIHDPSSGQVRFAIIHPTGGSASDQVAVPWRLFRIADAATTDPKLVIMTSARKFSMAPRVAGTALDSLNSRAGAAPVEGYWAR